MKTYTVKTTRQWKQEYEALFGIQGHRLDYLRLDEIVKAVKYQKAHPLCPARGSATNHK